MHPSSKSLALNSIQFEARVWPHALVQQSTLQMLLHSKVQTSTEIQIDHEYHEDTDLLQSP